MDGEARVTNPDIPLTILHCEICGHPRAIYGAKETGGYCERCAHTVSTHVLLVEIRTETADRHVPYRTGRIFAVKREKYEEKFPDRKGTQWYQVTEDDLKALIPEDVLNAPAPVEMT